MKTPSGKPASFSSNAIRPTLSGTFSEGFMIMQLPSASALGIVQFGTMEGKLNGTMEATTSNGRPLGPAFDSLADLQHLPGHQLG